MNRHHPLFVLLAALCLAGCTHAPSGNEVLVRGADFDFSQVLGTMPEAATSAHAHIDDFYLSRCMVTLREYEQFAKDTRYDEYPAGTAEREPSVVMPQPDCPALFVSFYDACAYCNYLSAKNGLECVYDLTDTDIKTDGAANGYRLPTKAEWFYALLGGKDAAKKRWWEREPYSAYMHDLFGTSAPVGTKTANTLGLYDMLGNGLEWTATESSGGNASGTKYMLTMGTGVPGNSIADYDGCTDFLRELFAEEPSAATSERFFYIGFRVARNAR